MGRKSKEYQKEIANKVEVMASIGISLLDISKVLDVSHPVLRRLYSKEWERGKVKANAKVAQRLFEKGVKEGDTASLIFWAKTQMGWREVQRVDHTSSDGSMASPQKITVEYVDAPSRGDDE